MTLRQFAVLSYANSFTLFHYRATEAELPALRSPTFFQDAASQMKAGDLIHATDEAGGFAFTFLVRKPTPATALTTILEATQ